MILMLVAGLLSNKQEAREVQFIANVCKVECRIHYIARRARINQLLQSE
jgi:hypothetical protein